MKCPFKLPVYKKPCAGSFDIRDAKHKLLLLGNLNKEQADYLVEAVNSYEKSEEIVFEVARKAIAKYDINAPPLTKNRFANEFVDSLQQALKTENAK